MYLYICIYKGKKMIMFMIKSMKQRKNVETKKAIKPQKKHLIPNISGRIIPQRIINHQGF